MSDVVRIDLLRHGEVVGGTRFRGSQDDPLTPKGWSQMQATVQGYGPWDALVSSPLSRCRAFAERLAEEIGVALETDVRLQEIHFGAWEGRSYAELMVSAPLALTRFCDDPFNHPPPGAESLPGFQARTLAALSDLSAPRHRGRRVLVITHGGVIRTLLCHARQWSLARLMEIEVPYGSMHTLRYALDAGEFIQSAEQS